MEAVDPSVVVSVCEAIHQHAADKLVRLDVANVLKDVMSCLQPQPSKTAPVFVLLYDLNSEATSRCSMAY